MLTAHRSTVHPDRPGRRSRVAGSVLAGLTFAAIGASGVAGAGAGADTVELPLPYEAGQEASFVGTFTTAVDATVQGDSETFELVMALEDEFGIEIPDEEAEKITTVQLAIDYASKHQKAA